MKLFFLWMMIFLSGTVSLFAQPAATDTVFSKVTTKQAKAARYKYLVDTTIKQYLAEPLNNDNEGDWNEALWSLELLQYKDALTRQKLAVAWSKAAQLPQEFQENLVETTYSLYKTAFEPQVLQFMQHTTSLRMFIRCAEYVLRADTIHGKTIIAALINQKFKTDTSTAMQILQSRLTAVPQPLPPLKDLFSPQFLPNQTVIYSLQRSSRGYPGLVIIRKPGGSFVKDSTGSYFNTAQLAKAITAYPFYLTNGNSPQGILRFSGFDVSHLLYIGPTTNLQLQLPYEDAPATFFGDSSLTNAAWSKDLYATLLPASWKNYSAVYQSYYAGKTGRTAVIMHGTTIDPQFYKAETYYPQTPSLGCLCSYESWDDAGHRTSSNQQQIVDALQHIGAGSGYVVVIDIDDAPAPVSIGDVLPLLGNAN